MSIYFQESQYSIKYHMNSHSSILKNLQIVAEVFINTTLNNSRRNGGRGAWIGRRDDPQPC